MEHAERDRLRAEGIERRKLDFPVIFRDKMAKFWDGQWAVYSRDNEDQFVCAKTTYASREFKIDEADPNITHHTVARNVNGQINRQTWSFDYSLGTHPFSPNSAMFFFDTGHGTSAVLDLAKRGQNGGAEIFFAHGHLRHSIIVISDGSTVTQVASLRESDRAWPVTEWMDFKGLASDPVKERAWEGKFVGTEKKITLDYRNVDLSEHATWQGFRSSTSSLYQTVHLPDNVSVSFPRDFSVLQGFEIIGYWRPTENEVHEVSVVYGPDAFFDSVRLGVYVHMQ